MPFEIRVSERNDLKHEKKDTQFIYGSDAYLFCGGVQQPLKTKAASDNSLKFDVKAQFGKSVKLIWKKKAKITSYVIYRLDEKYINKDEEEKNFRKIATVSAKKNSFTDRSVKENILYQYRIWAYQKKKKVCYSDSWARTTKASIYGDYCQQSNEQTPKSIELVWLIAGGAAPAGYEIYRADNFNDFKRIETGKASKYEYGSYDSFHYVDKTVKAGHTYYYKIRGYYIDAGKKTYTEFDFFEYKAVNGRGQYTSKPVKMQNASPSAIAVAITSEEYNGELIIESDCVWSAKCTGENQDEEDYEDYEDYEADAYTVIRAYSRDGKHWKKPVGEKLRIYGGETVYICFEILHEGEPVDLTNMKSLYIYTDIDDDDNVTYDDYSFWEIGFDALKETEFSTSHVCSAICG